MASQRSAARREPAWCPMQPDCNSLSVTGSPSVGDYGPAILCAQVLDVGRPAHDLLTRSRRWRVIARFRRSLYCRDGGGNIVCLGGISIGRGPLNVRCVLPFPSDWRTFGLDVGAVVEVNGHILRIGRRIRIDLADQLARLVLPEARQATSAISYARLACAARGLGSEVLHQTLAALTAWDPIEVGPYLEGIGRMGATSGWDALSGTLLPLRLYLNARTPVLPVRGCPPRLQRLRGEIRAHP